MDDLKGEAKLAAAKIEMRHGQITGAHERRQRQPPWAQAKKVTGAAERQRAVIDRDPQSHADTEAYVFLKPGRTIEAFGGVDDLRKSIATTADARPDLAAGRHVFGHRHNHWNARLDA